MSNTSSASSSAAIASPSAIKTTPGVDLSATTKLNPTFSTEYPELKYAGILRQANLPGLSRELENEIYGFLGLTEKRVVLATKTTAGVELSATTKMDTNFSTGSSKQKSTGIQPQASLPGLPRELRDEIFNFLAATEERVVLGRRFVEARKDKTLPLGQCFKQAISLHPLSMTCHQMKNEFQPVHVAASGPSWALVANNFDIDQTNLFAEYLESEEFFKLQDGVAELRQKMLTNGTWYPWDHVPAYSPEISLRFQMDKHAVRSAGKLFDHFRGFDDTDEEPPVCLYHNVHYYDDEVEESTLRPALGTAEVVTSYRSRIAPVRLHSRFPPPHDPNAMLLEDAEIVELLLRKIRTVIERTSLYHGCSSRPLGTVPKSVEYMETCWFVPFYSAVMEMRKVLKPQLNAVIVEHNRIHELCKGGSFQ